jgi:capsular exopolysaccharide synthesis family protein
MSKIYEALTRQPGATDDVGLVSVLGETRDPVATVTAGIPPPSPAPPAAPPALPAAAGIALDQVRSVALQVPGFSPTLPFDGINAVAGEQYRSLRAKMILHPRQPKLILVSSACPGDGKSTTAVNLAGALALKSESEGKTLLLEADFRRSTLHKVLGTPASPGLADVLMGACRLEDAIFRAVQIPNLYVLPAGKATVNPGELLDSSRWAAVCAACRDSFRFVVADSPPIDAVADYDLIQAAFDGLILVVRPDHSDRQLCLRALERVPKNKLLGVVLNGLSKWWLHKSYGYGSDYYAGADQQLRSATRT